MTAQKSSQTTRYRIQKSDHIEPSKTPARTIYVAVFHGQTDLVRHPLLYQKYAASPEKTNIFA
jgi:hypothetical protein